jgi:hypothetical protein
MGGTRGWRLRLAYNLVKADGGEIKVQTEKGKL